MARQPEGSPLLATLLEEYEYDAVETCAADSMCARACPLGIDTGKLVKQLRSQQHTPRQERVAMRAAKDWRRMEAAARAGLGAGEGAGSIDDGAVRLPRRRRAVSAELLPGWQPPMPPAATAAMPPTARGGAAAVYLPSCINRIFGPSPNGDGPPSLPAALAAVSLRAGRPLWIPAGVDGTCCAHPWTSKGYVDAAAWMANSTVEKLWRWSDGGELPVVIDATACVHGLLGAAGTLSPINSEHLDAMNVLDSIEWAAGLMPALEITGKVATAVIHPTCSSTHLGLNGELERVAAALAEEVVVPAEASCCGFAGDRGFLHPELTASATAEEADEVSRIDADAHLCANRTCEIGMERATGERYESFVYLLERLTRPG